MELQSLVFLHGPDEAALLARIDAVDPGLVALPGAIVDGGDAAAILADPGRFAFAQPLRSRRRLLLAHRSRPAGLVLHPQAEGPWAGRFAIDAGRSEVLVLETPEPLHGRLAPARLSASLHRFEGHAKIRKSPAFGRWATAALRAVDRAFPASSVDFVHVGPGAAAFAALGGQLTYLEEPVLPAQHLPRRQPQRERIPPAGG